MMTSIEAKEGEFFWGAASSSHQVEGGTDNDWTAWERETAAGKARAAARKSWPNHVLRNYPSPLEPANYISGKACDHYRRFREDFDLAKRLGHNAHRFSLEWSRIEPEEGRFDDAALAHYRVVVAALRERGLTPFVTLWHWTVPRWFAKRGGWLQPDAAQIFANYAERAAHAMGTDVRYWLTGNELETYVRHGYLVGDRPPAERNPLRAYRVLKALLRAHRSARGALKEALPSCEVGFTESIVHFEPYNRWPQNILATRLLKWWRNNPWLHEFAAASDFIGLQHYFHSRVRLNPFVSQWGFQYNENKAVSDIGWELHPESIYHALKGLAGLGKPVVITENGLADARDVHRAAFIEETLRSVARARREGVDVRGYFHWSLLDNFEWNEGFWPRFGLVEVDYRTLERKPRPSASRYRELIERGIDAL